MIYLKCYIAFNNIYNNIVIAIKEEANSSNNSLFHRLNSDNNNNISKLSRRDIVKRRLESQSKRKVIEDFS